MQLKNFIRLVQQSILKNMKMIELNILEFQTRIMKIMRILEEQNLKIPQKRIKQIIKII